MASDNDWIKYQKLVLAELERHSAEFRELKKDMIRLQIQFGKMQTELGSLKAKAGMWGAMAGAGLSLAANLLLSKILG